MTPYPTSLLNSLIALCYGAVVLLAAGGVLAGTALAVWETLHLRSPFGEIGLAFASLVVVLVLSAPAWAPGQGRGVR